MLEVHNIRGKTENIHKVGLVLFLNQRVFTTRHIQPRPTHASTFLCAVSVDSDLGIMPCERVDNLCLCIGARPLVCC